MDNDRNSNQREVQCSKQVFSDAVEKLKDQFPHGDTHLISSMSSETNKGESSSISISMGHVQYSCPPTIVITPPSPVASRSEEDIQDQRCCTPTLNSNTGQSPSRMPEVDDLCQDLNHPRNSHDTDAKTSPRQLIVPLDETIDISRPNVSMPGTSAASYPPDATAMCCYSSTPLHPSKNTSGDACFNDSLSSLEISPSPIPLTKSADNSPRFVNISEHIDHKLEGMTGDMLAVDVSNENIYPTHSDFLNQSYNRAIPLSRDCDPTRQICGKINFDRVDQNPSDITLSDPQQNYFPTADGSYYAKPDSSWLDLTYRDDIKASPQEATIGIPDPSLISPAAGGRPDSCGEYFVYPSIYVSSAGLISVLLKSDMSVEMTVDRTIRVVSHNHMMAVATDSRGTAACLYHPAVKVFQIGTTTDIATDSFRARMGGEDAIVFSNGSTYFKLEDWELQPTAPLKFSDIHRDQSVNLLFSSEGYGESLVASCMQVAAQAEYANLPRGGVIVRINGVKVTQTGNGDVTVVTGAKFIRLSPHYGTTRLGNRFVDIEVEKDWSVKLTRGSHSFFHNRRCSMVSNGKMEAGYDENNGLKVINLQPRHPLLTEPLQLRRPIKKSSRPLMSATYTPKRKPGPGGGAGRGTSF